MGLLFGATMGGVAAVLVFLIPVLGLTALLVWYFSLVQTRRRRALEVVTWLQTGLAGRGRVLATRWLGPSDLFASLDLENNRLFAASVHAHLGGRTRPDHVTLRCDLDYPPRFSAEVASERWTLAPADSPPGLGEGPNVQTRRLGVYVLTSDQHVVQNYRDLIRSLLNLQPVQVERLLLSPESPHLELSVNLNFASPPSPAPLFRLLQRLADVVPQHSGN